MSSPQQSYPCNQCAATLTFSPGTQKLECPYCGHEQSIEKHSPINRITNRYRLNDKIETLDYKQSLTKLSSESALETHLSIKCTACAAEFDFDQNIHAGSCPFCGQEIVSEALEHRVIKPWGLLPFSISEEQAKIAFKHWLDGLWLAPSKLKKFARRDYQLNGMYVPYWSFDCNTQSSYIGQRGDAYQVPVTVRVNINGRWVRQRQMQTRIRWSPARGRVQQKFRKVLIYASRSLSADMARELAPWDLENLQAYNPQYLTGFRSELYSINLEEGFSLGKKRMDNAIIQSVRYDIGGDFQRIDALNSSYNDIAFRHILLPFWVAGFQYGGKTYQFIVNGRTGEVQGERPFCRIKVALLIIVTIILFTVLLFAFQRINPNIQLPSQWSDIPTPPYWQ